MFGFFVYLNVVRGGPWVNYFIHLFSSALYKNLFVFFPQTVVIVVFPNLSIRVVWVPGKGKHLKMINYGTMPSAGREEEPAASRQITS